MPAAVPPGTADSSCRIDIPLQPRARIVSLALAGADPITMLGGPIPASRTALEKAGTLNAVGGPTPSGHESGIGYLMFLSDAAASAMNITHHAGIVRDYAKVRALRAELARLDRVAQRQGGRLHRPGLRLRLGLGDLKILKRQLALILRQLLAACAVDHLVQFFDKTLQPRVERFKFGFLHS